MESQAQPARSTVGISEPEAPGLPLTPDQLPTTLTVHTADHSPARASSMGPQGLGVLRTLPEYRYASGCHPGRSPGPGYGGGKTLSKTSHGLQ